MEKMKLCKDCKERVRKQCQVFRVFVPKKQTITGKCFSINCDFFRPKGGK